jgi:hypothetical protein
MYLDAIKAFPKTDSKLQTMKGNAFFVKTDVFKRQMWYAYEGEAGGGLVPLTPERVREIVKMNAEGKKPNELNEFVLVDKKEPDYSNVVGQDSLNRFEHTFKNKKHKSGNRSRETNQPNSQSQHKEQQLDEVKAESANTKNQGKRRHRTFKKNKGNSNANNA